MCVAGLRPLCAAFPVNYHIDNGSCHSAFRPRRVAQSVCRRVFHCKFSRQRACGDPAQSLFKRPLHDPVQALTLTEDLVEILAEFSRRGPCMRNLQMLLFRRFWYHDLAGSAPAAAGPCMTILWDSLRGPGMKILLQVLYNSLCDDLVEIVAKCLQRPLPALVQEVLVKSARCPHDLAQVLVRRSCGDPVEILHKSSLHSHLEDPLRWCLYESSSWRKFLYEDLVSSSIWIYIQWKVMLLQLRSCDVMSNASVAVPYPLLLVSGTLTSYPPHSLGALACVI